MENQNVTVIGASTKFVGKTKLGQDIRIDGIFEGEIISTADITVGETGFLNGTASCKNLTIYGKGEGEATCSELFTLVPNSNFKGIVASKNLSITEHAVFDGTFHMLTEQKTRPKSEEVASASYSYE